MHPTRLIHIPTCIIIAGYILVGCTSQMATALEQQDATLPNPTPKSLPLPVITLDPGQLQFSVDGSPAFTFSRNVTGYQQFDFATFLYWTNMSGDDFVRIQLDSLGMGYTSSGLVDTAWVQQWDQIFNKAEAEGLYVLPVFSVWYDWNAGDGYSNWKSNPLNQVNGGPAESPAELFQTDSPTQKMWLAWLKTLVSRWQGRNNILGWEIFSEVNLATDVKETAGIDFVGNAADIIRAADLKGRPVTASIADTGTWPDFYKQDSIAFINIHPYPPSGQLDRTIVSEVRASLARYGKPVLIGESGLNAATPDSTDGRITMAPNAATGIRHAIWAGVVSGAMNGRALWWEDSYGIYFTSLGIPFLQKYRSVELPTVKFVEGIDFTGFKPQASTSTPGVWGAAIGNEDLLLGWYRDASCEPPDWNLRPLVSKQMVTVSVPGTATNWRVDFYDVNDGTSMIGSVFLTRQGKTLIIPLPDFQDAISFKAHS